MSEENRLASLYELMKLRAPKWPSGSTVENEDGAAVFRDKRGNLLAMMPWEDYLAMVKA